MNLRPPDPSVPPVDQTEQFREQIEAQAQRSTPICEGWAETYENPEVSTREDRIVHFGQGDHVRLYGRDLRTRIRAAGFELTEFTAVEPDVLTYGLMRGETLFIAEKPV